ncbi:MAG: LexA family transcriptional regulator [Sulfurovum sp.]
MLILGEIIEKLKDIISSEATSKGNISKKIFDKDVAVVLNIPQSTFATMKKRNSIPFEEILEFCAKKKISLNWLFFDQAVDMLKKETDKFLQVRYFATIKASAGGGAEVFSENYEKISVDRRLIGDIENRRLVDAIHIYGDSMQPTIKENSIVFVDREDKNISKDGVFIVTSPQGLYVKRILFKDEGMVELISDNSDYAPEVVSIDELGVIGRVIGNIESL